MRIEPATPDHPRVGALLRHHAAESRAQTAPGSAHALDLDGLRTPDIQLVAAWDPNGELLGVGALRRLTPEHGELKSMHVAAAGRRRGVGRAILRHLVGLARDAGLSRLSLETGSWLHFAPARALYASEGFAECPPFGDYAADPNSVFMTRSLLRDDGAVEASATTSPPPRLAGSPSAGGAHGA